MPPPGPLLAWVCQMLAAHDTAGVQYPEQVRPPESGGRDVGRDSRAHQAVNAHLDAIVALAGQGACPGVGAARKVCELGRAERDAVLIGAPPALCVWDTFPFILLGFDRCNGVDHEILVEDRGQAVARVALQLQIFLSAGALVAAHGAVSAVREF